MTMIEIPTKAHIDSLHEENERSRRDLGLNFYDESSDLVKSNQINDINDNMILNVRIIQINDEASSDDHALNRKFVDDEFLSKTDSSFVKNTQDKDFKINTITNVRNIQINYIPTNSNQLTNKKYLNDELDTTTMVRLYDNSKDRYLQVRAENVLYNCQV